MTKREAKRRAWLTACSYMESLLAAGWPYGHVDDADPEESEADLARLEAAMREILGFLEHRGRKAA